MASTYTTNAGIELIGTGEQSGTWGDTTNTNLQIIDRLTNGVGAISLSGTTHTLTTTDGTLSDGQYSVLVFGGSPSGTNTVTISPNTAQHVYFVKNSSGQSVVLTQGSGGNVTVANGKSAIVYADGAGAGAAVVDVTNTFNFQPLDAELTAIAALATTDGNFIVGNGSTWVAESGSAARTSLGLGTIATQAANNVSITGGSVTGITDIAVADGGTGVSTVPTNGQLLIGNGSGYTVSTLTAGSGVSITNGSGSVTINATGTGGTVTSVGITAGALIDVTGSPITTSGNITVNVDLSELTDMTATMVGTDEFVVLDSGAQRRKAANEIGLSIFNNDSGFLTTINNSNWSGTDLSVANGGTGASTFTANSVLLGNGTSSFLEVAPGTSGNVLTSNGTTWASTAPAGGGALEFISSVTASNSATIDFTGLDSTYGSYYFIFENVKPQNNGVGFFVRMSTDNGSTYIDSASAYSTTTGSATRVGITPLGLSVNAATEYGATGDMIAFNLSAGNRVSAKARTAYGDPSAGAKFSEVFMRLVASTSAVDAIRFFMTTGNITSGTIYLYGIKDS